VQVEVAVTLAAPLHDAAANGLERLGRDAVGGGGGQQL
jgi:hypothetical protein